MTSSTNALRKLLKDIGMEGALEFGRISENWGALFSGPLAMHTSPESLSGSTLTVNVDSPSWLHQAAFFRSQMLLKLREYGISSLRFRQGHVRESRSSVSEPPLVTQATPQAREEVESMLSEIGDNELRDSIRRAALMSLSRTTPGRRHMKGRFEKQ